MLLSLEREYCVSWMDKDVVYIYTMEYYSGNMDGPRDYHTKK